MEKWINEHFQKVGLQRMHVRALRRFHQWAGKALRDRWADAPSPLQELLRYRSRAWFAQAQEDFGLRCGVSKEKKAYRHATNAPRRLWEDLLVDAFGLEWRNLTEDEAAWQNSRVRRADLQALGSEGTLYTEQWPDY